jgi:hypothetical protein
MADTKMKSMKSALTPSEYASLPPENRAVLEWLDDYMSTPLTEEQGEYWREVSEFVEKHPFTFRGEGQDEEPSGH